MASKRPVEESETPGSPNKRQKSELAVSPLAALPSMQELTKPWLLADITASVSSPLPPLPKPANPQLEQRAFTHMGATGGSDLSSYEELEWLGDACVEFIATWLIRSTFPKLKAGRRSQLREVLVRNKTLANYFIEYGMEERVAIPPELLEAAKQGQPKAKKTMEKIRGDVFEAYVGAIIQSHEDNMVLGMQIAIEWLKALWGREIKEDLRRYQVDHPSGNSSTEPMAPSIPSIAASTSPDGPVAPEQSTVAKGTTKDQLSRLICGPGVKITYEDMPGKQKKDKMGMPLYTIGVFLDGWGAEHQLLGFGTALKKSEAGFKAATRALEQKKLIKKFQERKAAFQMTRLPPGAESKNT